MSMLRSKNTRRRRGIKAGEEITKDGNSQEPEAVFYHNSLGSRSLSQPGIKVTELLLKFRLLGPVFAQRQCMFLQKPEAAIEKTAESFDDERLSHILAVVRDMTKGIKKQLS